MDYYITGTNIISALGYNSTENWDSIIQSKCGIKNQCIPGLDEKWPVSLIKQDYKNRSLIESGLSIGFVFESICISSVKDALSKSNADPSAPETLFIVSSTKGNIHLLNKNYSVENTDSIALGNSAKRITDYFGNPNKPLVISNACISGLVAVIDACVSLNSGKYNNIIVTGADFVSDFVYTGFQSFKSLSPNPCKPFDKNRNGLSLGEGAGTIIVSNKKPKVKKLDFCKIVNGAVRNDANHISGPSRTGEGLFLAITNTLVDNLTPGFIHAHGTATLYNDDMESIAIKRSKLNELPVFSIKGYIGHTLGAAGIIESVITVMALNNGLIPGTLNLKQKGIKEELLVDNNHKEFSKDAALKIASGFGGCNAAVLFKKL